jgi:hypothetical protein
MILTVIEKTQPIAFVMTMLSSGFRKKEECLELLNN